MATTNLKLKEVITKRVLNQIQLVKHALSKTDDFFAYNDILIIGHIVPKLPEQVLTQLLHSLKNINDSLNKTP